MSCLTVADPCAATRHREQPKYRLLDLLLEQGAEKLAHLGRVRSPGGTDPFQRVAVETLYHDAALKEIPHWRGRIVYTEQYRGKRLAFLAGRGEEKPDAVAAPGTGLRRLLLEKLPPIPRPLIALDFSLLPRHHPKEARSLRVQVGATLGTIRRFLWDRHLLLAGLPPGALEWLKAFAASPLVQASTLPSDEALALRGHRNIILLDPAAPQPLAPSEALEADAFIIGAIVDRTPRPGETRRLRLQGYYRARRLELRGSMHGVPNRINQIAEIILNARYTTCGDIDKAIIKAMSPRDVRRRAYIEIMRKLRGRKQKAPWSLYCSLKQWLPITTRDYIKAARMAGIEPEPGQPDCT